MSPQHRDWPYDNEVEVGTTWRSKRTGRQLRVLADLGWRDGGYYYGVQHDDRDRHFRTSAATIQREYEPVPD